MKTIIRAPRLGISKDLDSVDGELMDGIAAARDPEMMATVLAMANAQDVRKACELLLLGNPDRANRIFEVARQRPEVRRWVLEKAVRLEARLSEGVVTRAKAILKSLESASNGDVKKNGKVKL